VVAKLQINLTKVLGSLDLVDKVVNLGNWVHIIDCDFFHGYVINTNSLSPIFLLCESDWDFAGWGAWSNVPFLEHLLNLVLDFLIFSERA
jgi:hypothetical protein